MTGLLRRLITAMDPSVRNTPLEEICTPLTLGRLLEEANDLEAFRHQSSNLYERVRALFFLYALHRFHVPTRPDLPDRGTIPYAGYQCLLRRRFDEAIQTFRAEQLHHGPSDALSSALAAGYRDLAFQTLADQVRRSVREVSGNRWMFRVGHPADHPLRLRPELLARTSDGAPFPILRERTPVRMDLSHSGWSDIFFLGMDYPEGARVLNISIDLGVRGRDRTPKPPIEVFLRVIDEPVLRLVSIDLGASADVATLDEVFDFARDYLGLLKAAVIASGIVPPGLEGSEQSLADLLARVVGPGLGLEVVSCVNDIPKGSRLAVSTNLLAGLIAACMRATGQARQLTGPLEEGERRLVAARAILGEWLGGSGGGWQDSGGAWPGIKRIEGCLASEGDPEYGTSRGRLLPRHTILGEKDVPEEARRRLAESLVLVHGGMAQNVGPILEMVTEKYLLRAGSEWRARGEALRIFDDLLMALQSANLRHLGTLTSRNFAGPIQEIVPWASNYYTETLIDTAKKHFGEDYWGFWMLGGMSGGGMGFLFAPQRKAEAQEVMAATMRGLKQRLESSLPFAMEPVVYDFAINEQGTLADLLSDNDALMPPSYYALEAPALLRRDVRLLTPQRRRDLESFGTACRTRPEMARTVEILFDRLLPRGRREETPGSRLQDLLNSLGFDREHHEQIRADLRRGRIGLAQNRLPANAVLEDVTPGDVIVASEQNDAGVRRLGESLLAEGAVAVVTLAAGAGSRWTRGAGVVKALHPFCKLGGQHRTFLEVHLAKSRRCAQQWGRAPAHVVTTGYLTHEPTIAHLEDRKNYHYPGRLRLSPGQAVGLRLVPMTRDLRFAWEEMAQQRLDEQAQKVRDSLRAALLGWAALAGEGSDYTDNVPLQCLHPVGHWYEIPNMIRNGVLLGLLSDYPNLRYLMIHNVDTLGADLDPTLLGLHAASGNCLTYEVVPRRLEDRGGGLARVNGQPRLVESLALPREEEEFRLSYYNSLTTWVDIDALLSVFGLTRADLTDGPRVATAVRRLAGRVPTYVTLKEVKKRWGHGQEDVYPVCQFEKLWGDMSALPEVSCGFVVVSRLRGQQMKDPAQLDGWWRDGSAAAVAALCAWA